MTKFLIALIMIGFSQFSIAEQPSHAYLSRTWRFLIHPQFENAGNFSGGLAPVRVGDLWGFVDRSGKIAIEPQFNPKQAQFNSYFSDGLAAINFTDGGVGDWGFIDKTGRVVINPQFYTDMYKPPHFSEGLAPIRGPQGKFGYIDKTGRLVIPYEYDSGLWFSEGLAVVGIEGKEGYINKEGKLVLPAIYQSAKNFKNAFAQVNVDGKASTINRKGQQIASLPNAYFDNSSESLVLYSIKSPESKSQDSGDPSAVMPFEKFGYVDANGKIIIPAQFDYSLLNMLGAGFSDGLAAILFGAKPSSSFPGSEGGKYGFINRAGKIAINPKYDGAFSFSEGLAAVLKDKKYGYIDTKGNTVIPFVFEDADSFQDGVARVRVNGKYGFIVR